ncbi:MAG TPA: flagellar hook protein FlgE [Acidimicrobiales bacterium]|jgi:flagellar hook protein FlgE
MTERSLLAAVSGIEANQSLLDDIGNNIANSDTVGYKSQDLEFQDLLAEQLAGAAAPPAGGGGAGVNPVAIGSGVSVGAVATNLSEGSLEETGVNTDVAIQGNGYLVVEQGGVQYYTRDGSLTVDANGDLSTQNGGLVLGWQASGTGVLDTNAPLTGIQIPTGETIPASATTQLTLGGNLPAWNGVGTAPTVVTTTLDAYDALGDVVPVTLTFTGVAGTANTWTMQGTVPNPAGGTDDLWTTPPTIAFDPSTGQVSTVTGSTTNADGSLAVAVSAMPAGYTFSSGDTWDFEFPAPSSGAALTQFAVQQTAALQSQNGYASGALQSYNVGDNGVITGTFSNGNTQALAQISLATFANPGGLSLQGNGLYAVTGNSGQAEVGPPAAGGRGSLLGGELEQSNVDLGNELTNLITAQEAYEANTKVISTTQQSIASLEAIQ